MAAPAPKQPLKAAAPAASEMAVHPLPPGADLNVMPLRIRRALQLATYGIAAGMLYYIVLEADFGPREHVFSPLRRWYRRQVDRFWTLTPREEARYGGSRSPAAGAAGADKPAAA